MSYGGAAAKILQPFETVEIAVGGDVSPIHAWSVAEHASDQWSRAQCARLLGRVAVAQKDLEAFRFFNTEQDAASTVATSLYASVLTVQQALSPDANPEAQKQYAEAQQRINANVMSTLAEVTMKDNHFTEITMQEADDGDLEQFGQTSTEVQFNSLLHRTKLVEGTTDHDITDPLQRIVMIEALNSYRIKNLRRAGILDDCWYIVPSLIPYGLSETELGPQGAGYFLNSMTYASQGTTAINGEVRTQTIFAAGIDKQYETLPFEARMQHRHDLKTIQLVCEWLDLPPPRTTEEALHGYCIPKSQLPNGMIDFKRLCDAATDRIHGRINARSETEYHELIQRSAERQASLASTAQRVKRRLLQEITVSNTPDHAVQLLWDIAREEAGFDTLFNDNIQPEVWGKAALPKFIEARKYRETNLGYALVLIREAVALSEATGCGGGSVGRKLGSAKQDTNSLVTSEMSRLSADSEEQKSETDETDSTPDEMRCLKCHVTSPKNLVVRDKSWRCPSCKWEVDICTGEQLAASNIEHKDSKPSTKIEPHTIDIIGMLTVYNKDTPAPKNQSLLPQWAYDLTA